MDNDTVFKLTWTSYRSTDFVNRKFTRVGFITYMVIRIQIFKNYHHIVEEALAGS
jgi:hypothetical protein